MSKMNNPTVGNGDAPKGLEIIIVGAGIGGLFAAIALRTSGHHVSIYESSRFAQETGAAIHLPPNANGLLRRYGMKPEEHGGVTCEWVSEYRPSGERVFLRDLRGLGDAFPYPWQLCHRIDLHNALKDIAAGLGVVVHLQSRVVEVDTEGCEITLVDGSKIRGDMILGADGTHSVLRKHVVGSEATSEPSGTSAFRFLIPMSAVRSDPKTAHFAERNGELRLLYGNSRRIVVYPCRDNTELNFVCLHPDEESESSSEGWNQSASKELVLQLFDEYPEDVKALLAKADADTVKLWKLLDCPALPTWTKGRVALLGDAAHAFLPHQGQGGAQAIEDAAALGALFPLGVQPSEIEERLKLYMEARYDRATMIQQYTRDSAFKTKRGDHGGKVMDPMQFTGINFDHDAYDYASGILKRHLASQAIYRRMPLSFGPNPGPRQGLDGKPRAGLNGDVQYHTTYVTFKTKKSYLSTLLPSADFSIQSRGGWTTATFSITRLDNLLWLGGRGYSHFGLYIHNVVHSGTVTGFSTKYENVEKTGDFLPVLFENMADPIITGREELGFSKVFATLEGKQDAQSYELSAGWAGTEFCHISLTDLNEQPSAVATADPPLYHRKVIPSSNEVQKIDSEYTTASQLLLVEGAMEKRWVAGKAEIKFTELQGNDLQLAFPTLANIVDGLRRIEIAQVVASGIRSFP